MNRPSLNTEHAGIRSEDYRQALDYLYSRINYEKLGVSGASQFPFRLQRMTELFKLLGLGSYLYRVGQRPATPLIHIAGTKGKGSTATLVAAACTASGFRTGLYTSPHLNHLEERFQIDGELCSDEHFSHLVTRVRDASETMEAEHGKATFFELTTAMAMLHFAINECEMIVAEVGLGGRLDSTNVLASSVSVITSIGLDHQHVLGDTLTSIASEKAGIIKPKVPVVSGVEQMGAREVIERKCNQEGTEYFQLGSEFNYQSTSLETWGSHVDFLGHCSELPALTSFPLAMEGEHQAKNAAVAAASFFLLKDQLKKQNTLPRSELADKQLSADALTHSFSVTQSPCRLERFKASEGVSVIIDSSHNEDSIRAMVDSLLGRNTQQPLITIFGTSQDKSADKMLAILNELPGELILTEYQTNPRFFAASQLLELVPEKNRTKVNVMNQPLEACEKAWDDARKNRGTIVICGSFFLAAETRNWIRIKTSDESS